jgi:UDP-3-O-[3-hydroxymyristoyl] glucosamine N-acyltransferase
MAAALGSASPAPEYESDAQYLTIALKDARVHRSALVTDTTRVTFDFKSTIESHVVLQPTGGGRIAIGPGVVVMPGCVLRCGAEGLSVGRGAYLGEGVLCDGALSIGEGAVVEAGCILVQFETGRLSMCPRTPSYSSCC